MVRDVIKRLTAEWEVPRKAVHSGRETSLLLACSAEMGPAVIEPGVLVPPELADFWKEFRSARLFVDTAYGQWGLAVHSPEEVRTLTQKFRTQRPRDHAAGDQVLGTFLGDSDLLIVRCDPSAADYGRVVVALPLAPRDDWYEVAENLGTFFESYERAHSAKFWEEPLLERA